MSKTILGALLPLLLIFSNGTGQLLAGLNPSGSDRSSTTTGAKKPVPQITSGTLEKMIVASGSVVMDLNLNRFNTGTKEAKSSVLRFDVEANSFFTILVLNDELRGPLPSSMGLVPQTTASLPARLNASYQQLVVENKEWGGNADLVVSDGRTGFVFFNIEGYQYEYDASQHLLNVQTGRLLLSKEFATELGRPSEAGSVVGQISISALMRPIEISQVVNGEIKTDDMPALASPESGSVPGPDVVVGDLNGLAQFGSSSGTQVGLAVGTDSCNFGTENLHWFQLPDNDHPVIPQNMYRMSGGADNQERFEQIGQSNVKHAFTALTNNICGLGCNGVGGANLGSGCSDPYNAGLNAGPQLGSRAWINPFTGAYPRGDGATPPNNHSGHTHTGPSHRILTEISDLNTSLNPGATYFAEALYITPHEFAWCQTHPGQCNQNNNVSYRQYSVSGTGSPFGFSPVGSTQRTKAAINAWTGATVAQIQPDAANDGIGLVAYKVTQPSAGVYHYEYAVFNQNMDRGIQSFSIPLGNGVTLTNVGFHAPPQQPGWSGDGTVGNAGFSSAAWAQSQAGGAMTWSSETFAQNQNANAIRWGTMYNFRFDSNRPPQNMNATIGFFKTGSPITVQVQGPTPAAAAFVTAGGRITSATGQGLGNLVVTMTDSGGISRSTLSSPFGYYSFDQVLDGGTYTFAVKTRRYTFTPQTLQISGNNQSVDFVAAPSLNRVRSSR